MFRPFISYLFIFSMLFMSVESAVDSIGGEHPHGGEYAHLLDTDNSTPTPYPETNDNHCQQCCHGHCSNISGHIAAINLGMKDQRFSVYEPNVQKLGQAPPTPPPTA